MRGVLTINIGDRLDARMPTHHDIILPVIFFCWESLYKPKQIGILKIVEGRHAVQPR